VFLGWVQDHQEAREIYRSAQNFLFDRKLAKEELHVPWPYSVGEWEKGVRAKLELGYPVDYIDRKYTPPDWQKVYPSLGGPPVWSTENMQDYNDLINDFTQMLEPRDPVGLMFVKEAADASWEAARLAREKNGLPERMYQRRLQAVAETQRRNGAAKATIEGTMSKPATALSHSFGLEAGFKYYQGLDTALTRATKRRDNALRQIARWRDGLGGKARALSDKFLAEQALAERYGVAHFLDAEIDDTAGETMEAPPAFPPAGEARDDTPPLRASDEAAEAAPAVASSGGAEAAPAIASAGEAAETAPPIASADGGAEAASPVASSGEAAEAAPAIAARPIASANGAAEAARPRAPAGAIDMASPAEPINWVAWLTGAEEYNWVPLVEGARKKFKEYFQSKKSLVRHLVVDRKLVRPDQVCRELAPFLPAIEAAAPVDASSGQAGDAVPPVAPSGETAEAAPTVASSGEAVDAAPADEAAKAAPPIASADGAAEAAAPRAPADAIDMDSPTEPINWVAWLTGAENYDWIVLVMGAEKKFKQHFGSKRALVQMLVVDRKLVRPDEVCRELAQFLPAIEAAAPVDASSGQAGDAVPPVAPSGETDMAAEAPPRARAGEVASLTEQVDWVEARGSQAYPTGSGLPGAGAVSPGN
jgi:hypothetical protein